MEKLHVQQSRWWDWAAVGLLFVLLQTVASRLVATTWTPFLYLIQTFTYIGFVAGIALGYSQFRRGTVRLLTFIYMLIMLPLQWTLIIDQHASLEEQFASVAGRLFFSASDFFARQAGGRSHLFCGIDVHYVLDHQFLGRLYTRTQSELSWICAAGRHRLDHYSELR